MRISVGKLVLGATVVLAACGGKSGPTTPTMPPAVGGPSLACPAPIATAATVAGAPWLHPTESGYARIASVFFAAIQADLEVR